MAEISSIGAIGKAVGDIAQKYGAETREASFADTLKDAIKNYEQMNRSSDISALELLTGNTADPSSLMIASEKAEIALNLTVAIRNKAVDAYKEIMNMQV